MFFEFTSYKNSPLATCISVFSSIMILVCVGFAVSIFTGFVAGGILGAGVSVALAFYLSSLARKIGEAADLGQFEYQKTIYLAFRKPYYILLGSTIALSVIATVIELEEGVRISDTFGFFLTLSYMFCVPVMIVFLRSRHKYMKMIKNRDHSRTNDNSFDESKISESVIIGIDFGTTNSSVAIFDNGKPVIIPNTEGSRITPSVVAFKDDGECLIGHDAKRQANIDPDRAVFSILRRMGSAYKVTIDGNQYTPQEISALILRKLRGDAESYLGKSVTEAVIAVPAHFTDLQRQAVKDAGKIAGLDVKRIVNASSAAALAYGLDIKQEHYILVFEFGGGKFEVSVIQLGDGVVEVLATAGISNLGGNDFDDRIMNHLLSKFRKDTGIDLSIDENAIRRLRYAAEIAKIELSAVAATTINLPYITTDTKGSKNLDYTLTRVEFYDLISDLLVKISAPVENVIKTAGLSVRQLSRVLLAGGSTRMPAIFDAAKSIIGRDPFRGINPDECIAAGAAVLGGVLSGVNKDILLLDVTPFSLGIKIQNGALTKLFERNTTIPALTKLGLSTTTDKQTSIEIHILQSDLDTNHNYKSIGRYIICGIPIERRGVPKIEISISIDKNGMIEVAAGDIVRNKVLNVARLLENLG